MKNLLAAVTVLAVSTAQAGTIFVDANCPGGDGSIGDPYCSIQTAIDNAVDTDEIIVAPGTYTEAIDFIGKAIMLRSSDGRDVTIIDAQQTGGVVTCDSGEGPDTVLDGFTITGGLTTGVNGGGMFNLGSSPTVINCTFSGNTASGAGGGMANSFGSSPTVTNCTFTGNAAGSGGGMANFNSNPTVTNCTFTGNHSVFGGGMYDSGGSSSTVIDCTFVANTAENRAGGRGGGLHSTLFSSTTVINCTFVANVAADTDPKQTSGRGNDSRGGGLSSSNSSSVTVTGCTFVGNSATNQGGGLWAEFDAAIIIGNCVIWDNSPSQITGGTVTVVYSNVQGGFPGTGNIDADPLFVDPDNGNYRLSPGSPCIDAANNIAVPAGITTDLDGNPRFVDDPNTKDTGLGQCPVDMGAYEFQQGDACSPCPWDCGGDNDGDVGIVDFLAVLAQWDMVGTSCDFDGGGVGIVDFLKLLANWGPCP